MPTRLRGHHPRPSKKQFKKLELLKQRKDPSKNGRNPRSTSKGRGLTKEIKYSSHLSKKKTPHSCNHAIRVT